MIELITGGSGSGKSAYAEQRAVDHRGCGKLYYIATMKIYDEEGKQKVERHRRLREGKGFITIEQPVAVAEALNKMGAGRRTILLECMSNLIANELFSGVSEVSNDWIMQRICGEISQLARKADHLILVTNNVFEDGIVYAEATMRYMETLGRINEWLAKKADSVMEVVVGIPVRIKGQEKRETHPDRTAAAWNQVKK